MRTVRLSVTFNDQLNVFLDQGEQRFGIAVVEQKKNLVYSTIERFIVRHPNANGAIPATAYAPIRFREHRLWCSMISTTAKFGCISFFTGGRNCANSIRRALSGSVGMSVAN